MKTGEDLEIAFKNALKKANNYKYTLPTDIKLQFYAFYKQATEQQGLYRPSGESEIRNAFKINALFQVQKLSKEEAKREYIKLVKKHLE